MGPYRFFRCEMSPAGVFIWCSNKRKPRKIPVGSLKNTRCVRTEIIFLYLEKSFFLCNALALVSHFFRPLHYSAHVYFKHQLQKLFYITMTAIDPDNIESQEMGIVALIFLHEKSKSALDPNAGWRATRLSWAYPIRITASHLCCSPQYEKTFWAFVAILRLSQDPCSKLRNRVHVGSYTEIAYSLVSLRGFFFSFVPLCLNHYVWTARNGFVATKLSLTWTMTHAYDCLKSFT